MSEREARFTRLFDQHNHDILGYLARRVGQPEDAADLLSDVFLIAWRRLDEVPPGEHARLWLFGVARKAVLNHHRGAFRRQKLANRLSQHLPAPAAPRPEVVDADLGRALRRLSTLDREVLTLTVWEGLTPEEVGRILEVPAGTVRVRLHRARARLRRLLQAAVAVEAALVSPAGGRN